MHSAGIVRGTTLTGTSAEDFNAQFTVNVTAVAELTRLFLPGLRRAGGTVVLLNSMSGIVPRTPLAAYGASKFALRSYAESLRLEEPEIRVSSIYPGRVATDMQVEVRALEQADYRAARLPPSQHGRRLDHHRADVARGRSDHRPEPAAPAPAEHSMNTLLILLAPSANRVYAGAADGLVAAELQILLGDDQLVIEPITLAGIGYLRLDAEPDDRLRQALGRLVGILRRVRPRP